MRESSVRSAFHTRGTEKRALARAAEHESSDAVQAFAGLSERFADQRPPEQAVASRQPPTAEGVKEPAQLARIPHPETF